MPGNWLNTKQTEVKDVYFDSFEAFTNAGGPTAYPNRPVWIVGVQYWCDGVSISKVVIQQFDSISLLIAYVSANASSLTHGDSFSVSGYHSSIGDGGGTFVWRTDLTKSSHNGGTYIDPTLAFPADWSVKANRQAWFTAANSSAGVLARSYSGPINVTYFGAKFDDATSDSESFQAAVNAGSQIYVPLSSSKYRYYLADPVTFISFKQIFSDGVGVENFAGKGYIRALTCAFGTNAPDSHNDQFIGFNGLVFKGGTNPIDMGKCHGVRVEQCAFYDWTGWAICIYQSERSRIVNNSFWRSSPGISKGVMSFCTKADSVWTLTGTDSTTFVDRFVIESNQCGPTGNESDTTHIERFLQCSGIIGNTEFVNNTAHHLRLESINAYRLEFSNFRTLILDGSGISATGAAHAVIKFSGQVIDSVFQDIVVGNGTYFNVTDDWYFGGYCRATFINCTGGSAGINNTTKFGFNFANVGDHYSVMIGCRGGFYSAMFASNEYRGGAGHVFVRCDFSTTNITSGAPFAANKLNQDLVAYLGANETGNATATNKFKIKHSNGAGGILESFVVDPAAGTSSRVAGTTSRFTQQCSVGTVGWYVGSGTPEGVLTANIGSIYSRTDGGAGTSHYVKESGVGNTGWVAK